MIRKIKLLTLFLLCSMCFSCAQKTKTIFTNYDDAVKTLSQNQKLVILFTTHSSSSRKFEDYLLNDNDITKVLHQKNYLLVILYLDDINADNKTTVESLFKNDTFPVCGMIDKKKKQFSFLCYETDSLKNNLMKMLTQ